MALVNTTRATKKVFAAKASGAARRSVAACYKIGSENPFKMLGVILHNINVRTALSSGTPTLIIPGFGFFRKDFLYGL